MICYLVIGRFARVTCYLAAQLLTTNKSRERLIRTPRPGPDRLFRQWNTPHATSSASHLQWQNQTLRCCWILARLRNHIDRRCAFGRDPTTRRATQFASYLIA